MAESTPVTSTERVESSAEDTSSNNNNNKEPTYQVTLPPKDVLRQLAQQLEYYFSDVNLSKDTYLRTLRELNDGFVLASILANFAKVQSMCPVDSYHAVVEAAREFSDNLEVVHLHKETGKRVATKDGNNTLLAVGPIGSNPIPRQSLSIASPPSSPHVIKFIQPSTPSPAVQNTIILREVPQDVTEENVRSLFDPEKSPSISAVVQDVANCWFVTFDTTSRDDMMNAMMELRSKTLGGAPIKARLKAFTTAPPPSIPNMSSYPVYAGDRNLPYGRTKSKKGKGGGGSPRSPNKDKKVHQQQRRNNRNNHKKNNNNQNKSDNHKNSGGNQNHNDSNNNNNNNRSKHNQNRSSQPPPPPPLVESQFPALVDVTEDDDKALPSDGASTATTSTSSSAVSSKPSVVSGYAAALLKAPVNDDKPPKSPELPDQQPAAAQQQQQQHQPQSSSQLKENSDKMTSGEKHNDNNDDDKLDNGSNKGQGAVEEASEAEVMPLSWGGGMSFADILKKKEAAAIEAGTSS